MSRKILHWVFVGLLVLIGILLLIPGGFLIYLGGSPYYLIAGIVTLIIAFGVIRRKSWPPKLYGSLLFVTLVWGLWESDGALLSLLPRVAAWMVLGLWFLTPWYRSNASPSKDVHASASRWLVGAPVAAVLVTLALLAIPGYQQNGTGTVRETRAGGTSDWRHYGNDAGGTRFASLDQIEADNVGELEEVWRYRTGVEDDFKATPLNVDGVLYICAALNVVVAIDKTTGEELWRFDPKLSAPAKHQYAKTCRGVAYHETAERTDGQCAKRIVTATANASMIAMDAKTGELCEEFGSSGIVDLRTGLGEHYADEYYLTSPPLVAGDKLVVGGLVNDSQDLGLPSGVVRAFDAITGDFAWAWDLGRPGEPGEGESYTAGTPNVWSIMSYDPELNLIYAPTGNAGPDYFGGARREIDDEWSSAVVAIDAATGQQRWKYQTVHHDIWDYDLPYRVSHHAL